MVLARASLSRFLTTLQPGRNFSLLMECVAGNSMASWMKMASVPLLSDILSLQIHDAYELLGVQPSAVDQPGESFPHIGPLSSRTRRQPRQAGSQSHGATHRGALSLALRAHPSEPTDNISNENPKQQTHTFSFALGDNTFAVVTKNCEVLGRSCG